MRSFTYLRPHDTAEAITLAAAPGFSYLAGGTTLLDLMKLDTMRPAGLVDLGEAGAQFRAISVQGGELNLGAFATMADTAEHPIVARDYPVIAQSLELAASPQLRNMATLGGNVLQRTRCNYFRDPSWTHCNKREPGSGCAALSGVNRKHAVLGTSANCIATYPGDFAQSLIALDAMVDIAGPRGARQLRFEDLHTLPGDNPARETVLAPGELILAFRVPRTPFARRSLYLKVRDRQSYEFALASAAIALDLEGGSVREARIALGGVATKPWRARAAEAALKGRELDQPAMAHAAEVAFAGAVTHGQNDYKPELGRRTLIRALTQAAAMEA